MCVYVLVLRALHYYYLKHHNPEFQINIIKSNSLSTNKYIKLSIQLHKYQTFWFAKVVVIDT